MKIKIQPEGDRAELPYPFFIDSLGLVGRQDFWKGKPYRLIGFNGKPKTGHDKKTIDFVMFWNNPEKCIGLYPIFEHCSEQNGNGDSEWFTYTQPIKSIDINRPL